MLIIADMDGTLTESRQEAGQDMVNIMCKILQEHLFCIISGASYERIKKQVLTKMPPIPEIKDMYIVAQSGAEIYDCSKMIYKRAMSPPDKMLVKMLLNNIAMINGEILERHGIKIDLLNPLIVDKGSQITFSIAGVNTDISIKKIIDSDASIRKSIVAILKPFLPPNINMAIGGTTSIDFTPKGINKRFGVQYLQRHLGVGIEDIVYIGDKCFIGGNDWIGSEYNYHNVTSPNETLNILKNICSS